MSKADGASPDTVMRRLLYDLEQHNQRHFAVRSRHIQRIRNGEIFLAMTDSASKPSTGTSTNTGADFGTRHQRYQRYQRFLCGVRDELGFKRALLVHFFGKPSFIYDMSLHNQSRLLSLLCQNREKFDSRHFGRIMQKAHEKRSSNT